MKYIIISLFVLSTSCCLENSAPTNQVTIMSWNVQNLFDGVDNGVEYDDFSVEAGTWSDSLYELRLKNIVKIIELNKPDIIGFQEIEGTSVLMDLSQILTNYNHYVNTEDYGAIQLGFLSRYPIIRTGLITPYNNKIQLRSMLEVSLDIEGSELVIINNHWKSKRGGFSEDLRLASSVALKKRLRELKGSEVVVLGDLNENYNEYQKNFKSYETAIMYNETGKGITVTDNTPGDGELYTVWPDSEFPGSYRYRGEWESIDHFLLNRKLMDREKFYFNSFFVDNRDLLLQNNGDVKRWNSDFKTGYSDHLPLILKLDMEGVKTTLE